MPTFNSKNSSIESFTIEISYEALKESAYRNFDVNNVFPDDDILRYVKENYKPEDVFDEDELANWSEQNGYIKD